MPPALFSSDRFPVSAVICYDGNFNDLVRPVARAGGVLAIPANDGKEIEQGDRIGPSIQRSGPLRNDSLKANGGGGIGVAAPAQSIACPPLSPWPWVSRVHFAPRGASAGPGLQDCPGRLQLRLTCGAAHVF